MTRHQPTVDAATEARLSGILGAIEAIEGLDFLTLDANEIADILNYEELMLSDVEKSILLEWLST
ncbi:MAG: hypothetical protein AB1679_12205 [Actinomycetota bacterium]